MNHLSEIQLNEYLDQALDAPSRAAASAHLSVCTECQASLDELQGLTSALRSLSDEALQMDLCGPVLSAVKVPDKYPLWNLLLAAQVGFVLGIVLPGLTFLPSNYQPFGWLMPVSSLMHGFRFPALRFPSVFSRLPLGALSLHFPNRLLQPTSQNLLILAAAGLLLFGLENYLLLHRGKADR